MAQSLATSATGIGFAILLVSIGELIDNRSGYYQMRTIFDSFRAAYTSETLVPPAVAI